MTRQQGGPQISGVQRWARGDLFGLNIPADSDTLLSGAEDFLTRAFQASGALPANNSVAQILQADPFSGGGTGAKLVLSVKYASPAPDLPDQLFIKFSRNFGDDLRDRARFMMISEAKFAALSRTPEFPVTVPNCLFADVEASSGTGLIITERIAFGENGVEALYPKCMDHVMPEPLEHYRTIVRALATLSGSHLGGRLSPEFDTTFPYNPQQNAAAFSIRDPEKKLLQRASRMFEFLDRYPQLFPENIRSAEFHQQFLDDIPDVVSAQGKIQQLLGSKPEFIALSHWNANIDNCWFWRDAAGSLQCGFFDWAMVGKISVAQSIMGAISGAEKWIWDDHLDELLEVFITEYARRGGPSLPLHELRTHILLLQAVAGVRYFMSAPVAIQREITDLQGIESYRDERFARHENARIQLHMMSKMLNVWQTRQLGDLVRRSES